MQILTDIEEASITKVKAAYDELTEDAKAEFHNIIAKEQSWAAAHPVLDTVTKMAVGAAIIATLWIFVG